MVLLVTSVFLLKLKKCKKISTETTTNVNINTIVPELLTAKKKLQKKNC
jgi:hypothetical protein